MTRAFVCALLLLGAAFALAAPVCAQSAVDKRVSAIPDRVLLSQPPAALVDPGRQEAAQALVRLTRPAWFAWIGLQILALLYLWQSGTAARTRDSLRRSIRNVHAVRFAFGALLALAAQIAALPALFYDYRILRIMGISTQTGASWWSDVLLTTVLNMAAVGVAVLVILWLVDRSRLWWVYVAGLVFATSFFLSFVYPVAIEPLFNHFTPLPAGALSQRIHALAVKAGEGDLPIYVSDLSRRTRAGNAYVVGIGPSKRIIIGDTLLNTASDSEILFVVAHELGHDVHRDTLKGSLFGAFVFVLAAAFTVLISDRIGFRRDDDPLARLTLVAAMLGVMFVVFLPLINAYSRAVEAGADDYALALDPDRAAGTRIFVRFADEDLAVLCPGRAARIFWYTHPPLGSRISFISGQPNPCP